MSDPFVNGSAGKSPSVFGVVPRCGPVDDRLEGLSLVVGLKDHACMAEVTSAGGLSRRDQMGKGPLDKPVFYAPAAFRTHWIVFFFWLGHGLRRARTRG